MSKLFVLLMMGFLHICDDYYSQGWLANGKQANWWKEHWPDDKYKHDYLCALFVHSFSWSFMIMLPIAAFHAFDISAMFGAVFIANVLIHGFIDDLKANKLKLNLTQDQLLHVAQIVITFTILMYVC